MVNLSYNKNRLLPTAEELPCSDETPVDNQLQNDIPNLLLSLLAFIWMERDDWYFGVDMGVYYNPDEPAIIPDGFLAVGVKHDTGERGRLSYVLWEEAYIMPILALEVISEKYNGEYEGKLADYQTLGILYYAIYNPLSGRRGRFKNRERLAVYKLIAGKYELLAGENNRVWLPEIGLALGYEQGEHIAWVREWLYWYDQSGNRYLTAEERAMNAEAIAQQERLIAQQERLIAQQERLIAQQERLAKQEAEAVAAQAGLAKQEAEQKAQRLAERLRVLGINPDEV
ncbi:Uma2 family endonuclease [Microcystis aeruginosa]|uniref:Uma2 family endonuclease n=1 Tax=Microcystis aeruginosa TaxID=1126 RepID=UPI00232D2130|nr:Uma2 family endonuclease [Microcystis aeruginosa]MDB9415166.1 Uma2 family endonuclease [Microcystis aeruginosa CS-556/03]